MKIGYLLRTFPQLSETFVVNEIAQLEAMGHSAILAALHRPGGGVHPSLAKMAERTLYWPDIDKSRLPRILPAHLRRMAASPVRYARALRRWIPDRGAVWVAKTTLIADRFAAAGVEHLHTHFAWEQVDGLRFVRDVTGISYSLTVHAADIFSEVYRLGEALDEAAFVVTISDFNRRFLAERYGLDPAKCHVIHCGVETENFAGGTPPLDGGTPAILSIGRMVEKKGFDTLIRAAGELARSGADFDLKIVGDGPLRDDLVRLRGELGLEASVHFLGSLPHEAVRREIADCDLFVLACRPAPNGDMDGIPVVLMEAMAAGRPVVSTRISGIPELVGPEVGLLVHPEDARVWPRPWPDCCGIPVGPGKWEERRPNGLPGIFPCGDRPKV
jgi:colanic acid/amylovoran biosynthesis glycosyltransferase